MVTFIIPGNPIAKMRARHSTRGGFVRTYDPQEAQKQETRNILQRQLNDWQKNDEFKEMALNLNCSDFFLLALHAHIPYPKSLTNSKRNRLAWVGNATSKPDLDNIVKYYLDCANGILFPDDKQIIYLSCRKSYHEIPKTIITIEGKKAMDLDKTDFGEIFLLFRPHELCEFVNEIKKIVFFTTQLTNAHWDDRKLEDTQNAAEELVLFAQKYADKLAKIKKMYPKK